MTKIRTIKTYYLVFAIFYLVICFVPLFSGAMQEMLQKVFWLVLIGYTVIEFMDNLKDLDSET
ncbi:MAG: hypothetical protein Q4F05_02650 [bacterium]|nr:hypothetical protein [bacterium]